MPDWGSAGRSALSGFGSGAGLGAAVGSFIPGAGSLLGGLVGGGLGALGGGLVSLFGSGPSEEEIYNQLMQQYLESPDRARAQKAMDEMQTESTTQGPTAQEKVALDQALRANNAHFANTYGTILNNLAARSAGGGGGATQAALAASEGHGEAGNMAQLAGNAASMEEARRERARAAYTQMAERAQEIGDQYRRWASGQAHERRSESEQAASGVYSQALGGLGAIASAYKQSQTPEKTGFSGDPSTDGELGGIASSLKNPFDQQLGHELGTDASPMAKWLGTGGMPTSDQLLRKGGGIDLSAPNTQVGYKPNYGGFLDSNPWAEEKK